MQSCMSSTRASIGLQQQRPAVKSSCVSQFNAYEQRPSRRVFAKVAHDADQQGSKSKSTVPRGENLEDRIASGEFTDRGSTKERLTRPLRRLLASSRIGRGIALELARLGQEWRTAAAKRMPEARGDIREVVGQPVFIPLFKLFLLYGKIFRLSFGPKSFVIVSDPAYAKQILLTNAENYSKGILSEILEFVMGTGLIPANGEIWRTRRRAILPALHRKYVLSMVSMFNQCALHGCKTLDRAVDLGQPINMENYYSRLGLDIIGKAVFNYDFDSLTHDDPVIQAVYTLLREAEYRSTYPIAYWNMPLAMQIVPRQRRCVEALKVVNTTLDGLVAKCKALVRDEDADFKEDFLSEEDPSILHFLMASGDEISSKQLRDDLMTLLIAGHETTAAVLTWTTYLLVKHPDVAARVRAEVDEVVGDRPITVEDMRALKLTTRVINEAMRLYPQPPVLIRRALEKDTFDGIEVPKGSDIFISVWNLHRSPSSWKDPEAFIPERFGPLTGQMPNEVSTDFAYLPFGGGRRKCIGDQFAIFETLVGLSMLMRRYEFELAPGEEVTMTTGATIHTTNGLNLILKRRIIPPSITQPVPAMMPALNVPQMAVPVYATSSLPSGSASNGAAVPVPSYAVPTPLAGAASLAAVSAAAAAAAGSINNPPPAMAALQNAVDVAATTASKCPFSGLLP